MIIELTAELRLKSDQHSWAIQRFQSGRWRARSWYRTIPEALDGAVELAVRDIEGTFMLYEAARRVAEITQQFESLLVEQVEIARQNVASSGQGLTMGGDVHEAA